MSVDYVVRLLQMGRSTTQRSTTPNRTMLLKMPVSKISRGELGQKGNTTRHGEPQSAHGSPGGQRWILGRVRVRG